MADTIEDFMRKVHQQVMQSVPLEEWRKWLAQLPLEERLRDLPPEEILQRFKPEERLRGLGPEELRQIEDYLKTRH